MTARGARRVFIGFWFACLIAGSFLPWKTKLAIGTGSRMAVIDLIPYPRLSRVFGDAVFVNPHRLIHCFAFGIAALLAVPRQAFRARAAAAVLVFLLALIIEAAQQLLFQNAFEWIDLRDDIAGIATAFAIVEIYLYVRRRPAGETGSGNPGASDK